MDSNSHAASAPDSSPLARLGLGLLLGAALLLRLLGLEHGLPHSTEPDGLVFATQTQLIRSADPHPEREPLWGFYPQLVPRIAALLPAPERHAHADLRAQLSAAARSYGDPRLVVALLSLLAVPAAFGIARRFLDARWSLLVAGLTATSTLTLWFAQQARPHAAAAALALCAVVAALRIMERGRWIDVLLAGAAAALAIGSLQFGIFVLPPILLALLFARGRGRPWRALAALVVLAHAALGVLAFYPFLLLRSTPGGTYGIGGGELQLSGHRIYLELLNGSGARALFEGLRDYEPWIALCGGLGLLGLLVLFARGARLAPERRRALWIVLAYALPFALALALYQRTYQRFAIPLVPFLALAAVAGAAALATRKPRLAHALEALLLLPQLVLATQLALLRSRPDTVAQAAEWIAAHVQPAQERVLFLPTHDLPLPLDEQALDSNATMMDTPARPWFRWQRALAPEERLQPGWKLLALPLQAEAQKRLLADPREYLRMMNADWFVVEVYTESRKPLVLDVIHPELEHVAERVARFAPEDGGTDDLPLAWADDEYPRRECWALRMLGARHLGPAVEIWRARR